MSAFNLKMCNFFLLTTKILRNFAEKHAHVENTPLNPTFFFIVNLGFTRVYNFSYKFLIQNIDCGYLLEMPRF